MQQTTLPLGKAHPLRNLTTLAAQIALPGEHAPQRFPSFPALERTALMGFNQPATLNLPAATPVAMTLFRSATYPVWADQATTYQQVVDYAGENHVGLTFATAEEFTFEFRNQIYGFSVPNRAATIWGPGLTGSGVATTMSWPILGRDSGTFGPEFTFVPGGARMALCGYWGGAPPAVACNVVVNLEQWVSPGQTGPPILTSAAISIAANKRGGLSALTIVGGAGIWVRPISASVAAAASTVPPLFSLSIVSGSNDAFTYTDSAADAGVVTFSGNVLTGPYHLPLVSPNEFGNSALPWFASRVTAVALLGTNVSQVLNKGGTILGGRLSPAVISAWDVTSGYINTLHPAEKAFLPLELGLYSYCPPSTDLAHFYDYTMNTSVTQNGAPVFILGNDALYNKMYVTASAVAETLACTVSWHTEFRTSSALFQVGLCGMSLETLHQAQLVLATHGFFFENINHRALLNNIIKIAREYAPALIGAFNPSAGRIANRLIRPMPPRQSRQGKGPPRGRGRSRGPPRVVRPRPGPSRPPTTTAMASGMSGKPKLASGLDMYLNRTKR